MKMPENINLPYFAYGLFKPDEISFNQIEADVEGIPERTCIEASLYIRDGLPLLQLVQGAITYGYIIHFKKSESRLAYEKISDFEPSNHYKWAEHSFDRPKLRVNVLVGKKPEKGSIHFDGQEWKAEQDPVFNDALEVIGSVIKESAT